MAHRRFFKIPNSTEVKAQLVQAIPSNWSWVDGRLIAPEHMLTSGLALSNTGLLLSRFQSGTKIVGVCPAQNAPTSKPNLVDLLLHQRCPGFLHFEEVGYEHNEELLHEAKQLAIGFLRKGYGGELSFYRSCSRNIKHDNSARVDIRFYPWNGAPIMKPESGDQPARIQLEWNERYGGREEHLAEILEACRSLELVEYTPTPGQQ